MKCELIWIFYFILVQLTKQDCIRQSNQLTSLLKRNHQNVLSSYSGALISSKNQNNFGFGDKGSCLRDDAYTIVSKNIGHTGCAIGQWISLLLIQKYLLNTLKIWFWEYGFLHNQNIRYYNVIVYAKFDNIKNKIYESNLATGLMIIEFPDQFVEEFQVVNVGGNTYDANLHIIKVEAYYKFS